MDLMSYISKDALILIPVMWLIGYILKRTEFIFDNWIPFIILILSMILSNLLLGMSVTSTIQGILVGGTAVGLHATKKQINKE